MNGDSFRIYTVGVKDWNRKTRRPPNLSYLDKQAAACLAKDMPKKTMGGFWDPGHPHGG